MNYILLDLEFNQDFTAAPNNDLPVKYPFEIIQIGAVKYDSSLSKVSEFNNYIKPAIYKQVSPHITELTSITTEQLIPERTFPVVFQQFLDFIGNEESILVVWGMSDIKELFKSADYFHVDSKLLPRLYINIQPYTSIFFGLPHKKLLNLRYAAESLNIPTSLQFHNALHDAYYTGEIFKKIYNPAINAKIYDPAYIPSRRIQRRQEIDTENLIRQFEKMYERAMTEEEQSIILLAYKMGKTRQFLR